MKAAVIADVHLHNFPWAGGVIESGLNERCRAVLRTMRRAVDLANKQSCEDLFVAGDLFDVDDPTPQIVAAAMAEFRRFNGNVHLVVGNHDQHSTQPGDHALGPMEWHETEKGKIYFYESPQHIGDYCLLPFRPEPVIDWLEPTLLAMKPKPETVIAHFGVADDDTPDYLLTAHDQLHVDQAFRIMAKVGVRVLIVGNWHNAQTWKRGDAQIVQVGALAPTGFDNLGPSYGHVVLVDPSLVIQRKTVPGPRFLKLLWDLSAPADLEKAIAYHGSHVYVHLEASPSDMSDAKAWVAEVAARLPIKHFKVTAVRAEVVAQAASAAKSSTNAATREVAVARYVARMPLDTNVSRKAVLRKVLRYLEGT